MTGVQTCALPIWGDGKDPLCGRFPGCLEASDTVDWAWFCLWFVLPESGGQKDTAHWAGCLVGTGCYGLAAPKDKGFPQGREHGSRTRVSGLYHQYLAAGYKAGGQLSSQFAGTVGQDLFVVPEGLVEDVGCGDQFKAFVCILAAKVGEGDRKSVV